MSLRDDPSYLCCNNKVRPRSQGIFPKAVQGQDSSKQVPCDCEDSLRCDKEEVVKKECMHEVHVQPVSFLSARNWPQNVTWRLENTQDSTQTVLLPITKLEGSHNGRPGTHSFWLQAAHSFHYTIFLPLIVY